MYIRGKIDVKIITGRRGPFAVGMLTLPFGTMETKFPQLDQFEPGHYEGEFDITEIYIDHYRTGHGQFISKLCAKVSDLIIAEKEEAPLPQCDAQDEGIAPVIDPLVDAGVQRDHLDEASSDAEPDAQPQVELSAQAEPAAANDDDVVLFGDLYADVAARRNVALDPAASGFRHQIGRLRALNFKWDAKARHWFYPSN